MNNLGLSFIASYFIALIACLFCIAACTSGMVKAKSNSQAAGFLVVLLIFLFPIVIFIRVLIKGL